jgi:sugar phosphate isomerase/epimerase
MSSTRPPLEAAEAVGPPYTSAAWPVGAALLQFPGTRPDGVDVTTGSPELWESVLREVAVAGFTEVDLTDSWVRPGDLSRAGLDALGAALSRHGLTVSAISVTRRSVVAPDPERAAANLAYALRTVEAAAHLGVRVVGLGLHEPLTAEQLARPWFWHARGHADPDDREVRALAVSRFREVGRQAAAVGVEISLEMYEDTYLGTAASSVELVTEIGLANVGLNPDVGNIVRLHREVEHWEEILAATLPFTNYWHVKNYLRDHDPATGAWFTVPAPLELGFVDYRRAVGMALDAGFAGPICVEHYGGDGLSVSARNRDYLRRILAVKLGE